MPTFEIAIPNMDGLLNLLSFLSTPVIVVAGVLHLLMFLWLRMWAGADLARMLRDFEAFTRGIRNRSLLSRPTGVSDQIDAFLEDVREVLSNPDRAEDRQQLLARITILDEKRTYLQSQSFETWYNVCRTMIEAYPMAGILGTLIAIGAALQVPAEAEGGAIAAIVRYFGDAIWSTVAGLVAAMILMFLNSVFETQFRRLSENRHAIRDTILRAKRELLLAAEGRAV